MLQKRHLCLCILIFLVFISSKAQVNLQTGSAVFSLPLFSWQDDKSHLSSVVALSYSSGNGLKVNDLASNVGQGWNMVAGGVITRLQMSEPDDQPAFLGIYGSSSSEHDVTKYPAGFFYDTIAVEKGCPKALTKYPIYGAKNQLYAQHNSIAQDKEQDYFSFQFNGKSGMFIIDTVGGGRAVPLGDTKLKIAFQFDLTMKNQGIRTTITSFTVTDVDGLIYKFTLHGLTKLTKTSFSNADGTKQATQPKIKDAHVYFQSAFDVGPTSSTNWINTEMAYPYIISNWYLSEVDDPFTSRKIFFNYNPPLNLSNAAGTDISYNSGSNNYVIVSYKKSVTTVLEIASIVYPDGHQVSFNYASSFRYDYPGQKALTSVNVTYSGRYLSQYQLNTSYFILTKYGNPSTTQEKSVARLCLRSVKKIGVDLKEDSPPYAFDYFTGSNNSDDFVPPPFFYAKDIWGYFNGNNSIAANSPLTGNTIPVDLKQTYAAYVGYNALKGLCFQNENVTGTYYNAKAGYAQNGLLKQIIYPTGGSLTYQYGQNTGSFMGSSFVMNVGGVHVTQTSSADGGYSNGCGTPVVTKYDYVMNGTGSASSLWGLETPVNSVVSNNSWKEERQTWSFTFSYPLGTCVWHYVYPGIMSQAEAVSLDEFQKIMVAISPVLGILSVVTTINDVINVCGPESGLGEIVAVVLDVITAVLSYVLSCPQRSKYTGNTVYYNFDLNEISPMPAQFKRVEITESPGTTGKTVQQFTHGDPDDPNGNDYALWFAAGTNTTFSPKQRFAPWAYGLPKLTTIYDVNGNKIKETQNDYDFNYALEYILRQPTYSKVPPQVMDCKCQVINNYSQRSDNWVNPNLYNDYYSYVTPYVSNTDLGVDFYFFYTGRTQLKQTHERVYRVNDASQFVETLTSYSYNSDGNAGATNTLNYDPFLITTTQSNGDVNYKRIKYSSDYNTGVLATLVQKNMVSVPVATNTYVQKSGSYTSQYLSEKVTEYVQLSNLDIKPSRILEQRFTTPATSFTPYSGPTTTNYAPYKIPQVFTYDANYNLAGLQDEGGRTVTNIYDYNDKYIVASVINANAATDKPAYTSFESGDLSRSGWSSSGSAPTYSTASFITGSKGLVLNGTTLTASLNTAKPYILSFWATNSNVSVSGVSFLVKSAPTYNGMTYYEYSISAGPSSVSVSGNSTIDELRLFPAAARMRTVTYDPLIGKTSEADENNRIVYYTYDNLARLQMIKDEAGNIVKMYEYNNVSAIKQQGCPATYYNHLISELIRKSDCGAGYQGSDVSFTIPANTYSSSSQYDADVQAEIYLLTNGQTYANSQGSCSMIYYNVAVSKTDTTQSCGPGYAGGPVTYTVPANTYSSIISQDDANQQAYDDTTANAQAYINAPANAACSVSTTPDWEWFPGDETTPADPSYCSSVNGNLPPHLFMLARDLNPNSSTYNQTQYKDAGPNNACPANTYYNASQSQAFTRNNCGAGYTGGTATYTVAPGTYNSTTSQAAADQLATNDINANGQNYANNNGACNPTTITVTYSNTHPNTYNVRFTNVSTHMLYNFTASANGSGTLGTVPPGSYDIYICPNPNSGTWNYSVYHSYYSTGVTCGSFSNITALNGGTIYIY